MGGSDLQKAFADLLLRHVVPIFGIIHGKWLLQGNGFLISASNSSYLVSAAHVFDRQKHNIDIFYYIEPGVKRKIGGDDDEALRGLPSDRNHQGNHYDVGIIKLGSIGLPPYPAVDKDSIPIQSLVPSSPRQGKTHLFLGFPKSQSKPNVRWREIESEPFAFYNLSVKEDAYDDLDIDPMSHIAVPFRKEQFPGSGGMRDFPSLNGMSGSPIWLLDPEISTNCPAQTPIVGIFTDYRKCPDVLIGIDISFALDMIREVD
ncbi:MAG: hypothetical protein HC871_12035 [Rhizobiales bacterium]|nr:hypothetical protein [Hyphomicrobiales bacterium]